MATNKLTVRRLARELGQCQSAPPKSRTFRGRRAVVCGAIMALDSGLDEWLETDGLGGFASGTRSGLRTRRYHGLLTCALTPPQDRRLLVQGFAAWVEEEPRVRALAESASRRLRRRPSGGLLACD